MKIRLAVSEEKNEEVKSFLLEHGFELDDDAEFMLTEKSKFVSHIPARKSENNEKTYVAVDSIVFAEAYGHDVYIHCDNGEYITNDPLYQLEYLLDPVFFIRISNSVIVSRTHINEIKPGLSRKFVLILSDKSIVDVTRSYYNSFKNAFGI